MKLIIGLGNPEDKYGLTRHNIGFRIVDELAQQLEFPDWKESSKHHVFLSELQTPDSKLIIAKPQTFMNLSGQAVSSLVSFYKLNPEEDLLICYDDKDMLFGKLREKQEGGSGGHNGIKSIISSLGTEQFHRLKFGIGHEEQNIPTDAFVLQKFTESEEEQIPSLIKEALQSIEQWLT